MSGISAQTLALAWTLLLSPLSVSANEPSPATKGMIKDPVLPSLVTPGRPHGVRDPHARLAVEQQIRIALQHKQEGRPHQAIDTLAKALMHNQENAQLYAVRGSLYLELGKVTAALRDLEAALRLNPDDVSALTNRAQAYRGFDRTGEALADLDRAVELAPDLIAARFNRGVILYEKGEMEKALADFNHCIAIDPHAPGPYFNRAAVYDAMHKRTEAVADINRFMNLTENENWKDSARDILKAWSDKNKAAADQKGS